ncbi:MAG: hypothetical protein WC049_09245 [Candidatus Ratteibacteria bacterium]
MTGIGNRVMGFTLIGILYFILCAHAPAEERAIPTLSVNFNGTISDTIKKATPVVADHIQFVEGKDDKGILLDKNAFVSFDTKEIIDAKRGAIEFWFKPDWNINEDSTRFLVTDNRQHFRILKSKWSTIGLQMFTDDWKGGLNIFVTSPEWKAGTWHYVKADWDIEGETVLTVDDKTVKGWFTMGASKFTFGTRLNLGGVKIAGNEQSEAGGVMDDLKVFKYTDE